MGKTLDISQMLDYVRGMKDLFQKGYSLALIETVVKAEKLAKANATDQFTGRSGRRLSGRLLNAIYSGYTIGSDGWPQGFIGTKGIPYGAVHEYGHDGIEPVKAKHLWVKLWGGGANRFKRMTPGEFVDNMKRSRDFRIFHSKAGNLLAFHVQRLAGKSTKFKLTPLFSLKDKVEIPERPYLRPAIDEAFTRNGEFSKRAALRIAQELTRIV